MRITQHDWNGYCHHSAGSFKGSSRGCLLGGFCPLSWTALTMHPSPEALIVTSITKPRLPNPTWASSKIHVLKMLTKSETEIERCQEQWSIGFVVRILWSSFLLLFCFEFCLFLSFHSSQKKTPKKPDTAKTPKNKMQKKRTKTKAVSAVVFTNSVPNFWGWALKNAYFLLKNTIKM